MNSSGDAAEQVVRFGLEGTEVVLKLTGAAAKNIAAALYAVMKNRDKNKTKGRQRLSAMLKSGRELKVFSISEEHLKQFAKEAKRYGVVYCALRGREKAGDGLVDVMVRAEDASKINRIVDRFRLLTVDTAAIKTEVEKDRAGKAEAGEGSRNSKSSRNIKSGRGDESGKDKSSRRDKSEKGKSGRNGADGPTADVEVPGQERMEISVEDRLLDEMMGTTGREAPGSPDPSAARAEKRLLSAPTSREPARTERDTIENRRVVEDSRERPSVRQEIREIQAGRREKESGERAGASREPENPARRKAQPEIRHVQPRRKKKGRER